MAKVENSVIPTLPDVESRVDYIVDIMERLDWKRGKTAKVLAKAWGLSEKTVEGYSSEASRRVTADKDTATRDITVAMQKLLQQALAAGKAKDAAMVGKLLADVSGANAPSRSVVELDTVKTPAAARAEMSKYFGSVGEGTETDNDGDDTTTNDSDSDAHSPTRVLGIDSETDN